MLFGHYGVALAIKAVDRRAPLGWLLLATQAADIVWIALSAAGIERYTLQRFHWPGSPLILTYQPWSHSLLPGLLWGIVFALAWRVYSGTRSWAVPALLFLASASHWPLDWLMHVDDMPLWFDCCHEGLGLWRSAAGSFAVEVGLYLLCAGFYWLRTRPTDARGSALLAVIVLAVFPVMTLTIFIQPQIGPAVLSAFLLALMAAFAVAGHWLDRWRRVVDRSVSA